jgi:hypothetical protein
MAAAAGATYFQWANPFPENAYFRQVDFKGLDIDYVRHPSPDMAMPTNKLVRMPLLDRACLSCGSSRCRSKVACPDVCACMRACVCL